MTVSGWFYFYEEDNLTQRPARRTRVELWDTDDLGIVDRWLLVTAYTDDNGYYEFPPVYNNEGGGPEMRAGYESSNEGLLSNGLDVFVKIFTDSTVVWVSNSENSMYVAETSVHYNIPDGLYNMGSWFITEAGKGAYGILDTILIGHDYAYSLGYDHAQVHARWPMPPPTGVLLNSPLTIDFVDGDEWDEDVILHEYGHSVQHSIYGEWIPLSGGEHHWNIPSSTYFAFSEGWANFWGVAANFEMGYGDALYPRDSWYNDPGVLNVDLETDQEGSGANVEGAVACILWDIYDSNDDDRDNLDATMTPVWDVFTNYLNGGHHVYTIYDFWAGWRERGWNAIQSMWGIYFDHGIQCDGNPPSNPTGWSSSHTAGGTSSDNTIDISWWGATDDMSGVHGYSYEWTTSSTTIPDTTMETTETSTTSPMLSNGGWYFHIRTVDNAGWWNSTALHIGPFNIMVNKYFRSEFWTQNGLYARKLANSQGTSYTNNWALEQNMYGIRVWKRTNSGTETEITSGTPVAQVTYSANGYHSNTWNCPQTSLTTTDVIVVRVYTKATTEQFWSYRQVFVTEQLGATQLDNTLWTVYYYLEQLYDEEWGHFCVWYFGSSSYNSRITNFSYSTP